MENVENSRFIREPLWKSLTSSVCQGIFSHSFTSLSSGIKGDRSY
ncbi:UNVERIFIED_ORG: hypothetical protein QOE_4152 [Clostridioides difficile F501]